MNKRLFKSSLDFLKIAHAIWQLFDYYFELLDVDPSDDPLELAQNCSIYQQDGLTFIRFKVPRVSGKYLDYDVLTIQDILNDYLRIVILPNQKELKPYCNGKGIYDICEPLYVDSVAFIDDYMIIDVLYIDNPVAFRHARTFTI